MALTYSIEWTKSSWNPVTGCDKVSEGCRNCYAERMANRLKAMGQKKYYNGFKLTTHEHMLSSPFKWRKSKIIFVNSMSDLFHDSVSDDFIFKVFKTMNEANWHIFQLLTKRPDRLAKLSHKLNWSNNIWMGVSVENEKYISRIDYLRKTGAKLKFISFEPLLGLVNKIDLNNIGWIIVGGESGPKARPINAKWIRNIRDHCLKQRIPFFFKQWGGVNKKLAGRELDGKYYNQIPEITLFPKITQNLF